MKFPKQKPKSLKTVRRYADDWFARFIRLRGTQTQGTKRIGICVTCNKPHNIWDLECGHFMGRRWDDTRWDDLNSHCQDTTCNKWNSGEQYIMGKYIERKYGENVTRMLHAKSRQRNRFIKIKVQEIGDTYKKKCEEIVGMKLSDSKWNSLLHGWR